MLEGEGSWEANQSYLPQGLKTSGCCCTVLLHLATAATAVAQGCCFCYGTYALWATIMVPPFKLMPGAHAQLTPT